MVVSLRKFSFSRPKDYGRPCEGKNVRFDLCNVMVSILYFVAKCILFLSSRWVNNLIVIWPCCGKLQSVKVSH